jgi:malonyl-CoA decarboxylase
MALVTPINDFLGAIADRGLTLLGVSNNAQNLSVDATVDLCARLLSSRGNASGLALSYKILKSYEAFPKEDKLSFFQSIISIFSCDLEKAETQATAFLKSKSSKDLVKLSEATTPRYAEFISRLNQAPSSTMSILNMRSDLLGYLRKNPDLRPLDHAFVQVFSAWFNRG